MRDAGGQLSDGLELLGLSQLPLEFLDMGNVLGHVGDSEEISLAVLHRRERQKHRNRFTGFGEPHGLHVFDAFAALQPLHEGCVFAAPVRLERVQPWSGRSSLPRSSRKCARRPDSR